MSGVAQVVKCCESRPRLTSAVQTWSEGNGGGLFSVLSECRQHSARGFATWAPARLSAKSGRKYWVSIGALIAGVGAYGWNVRESGCAISIQSEGRTEDGPCRHVEVDGVRKFNHVVLGGGTAGCVIAYLLGKWIDDQKMDATVLLVDGGPGFEKTNPKLSAWYDMWGEFGKVHESVYEGDDANDTSVYPITPSDHRGLGGCGAHDTRIFFLPTEAEQADYANVFGWSLDEFKVYMQTAMNLEPACKACPNGEKYFDLVIHELSKRLGIKRLADDRFHGSIIPDSVAYFDVGGYVLSDNDGIRWTPALLINSPNDGVRPKSLKVLTNAEVDKVNFTHGEIPLVESVDVCIGNDETQRIQLQHEGSITLSAGSIGNAAILQRSGVGDPEVLERAGIDAILPHPEVGHGVDHEEIAVQYAPPAHWPDDKLPTGGLMGWALGIFRRLEGLDQLMQAHFSIAGPPYDDEITVVGTPNNTKPDQTKGYRVEIQSPSPSEAAKLKYEYSDHEKKVFLKGTKEMIIMFEALRSAGLVGERIAPPPAGMDLDDDNALWKWIHDNKGTAYHWLGTCKAGAAGKVHPGSVVDPSFRLRIGTDKDKVVDNAFLSSAAILPFPPTANPHVTIQSFAVAEAWSVFQHLSRSHNSISEPYELQEAKEQLKNNKNKLQIRAPGEEKPNLHSIARQYNAKHEQQA